MNLFLTSDTTKIAFETIGYLATTLTTICSIPQLYKILKTKDSKSVSLNMYIIMTIGYALWIVYGVYIKSYQMMIGNSIGTAILLVILTIKLVNVIKGVDEKEFPFNIKEKKQKKLEVKTEEQVKAEEVIENKDNTNQNEENKNL